MLCPIIIAIGVKRSLKPPKGPDLEMREYSNNPMTTVGSAIRLLSITMIKRLPAKLLKDSTIASGTAKVVEIVVEATANLREVKTIKYTSLLPDRIKPAACTKTLFISI